MRGGWSCGREACQRTFELRHVALPQGHLLLQGLEEFALRGRELEAALGLGVAEACCAAAAESSCAATLQEAPQHYRELLHAGPCAGRRVHGVLQARQALSEVRLHLRIPPRGVVLHGVGLHGGDHL